MTTGEISRIEIYGENKVVRTDTCVASINIKRIDLIVHGSYDRTWLMKWVLFILVIAIQANSTELNLQANSKNKVAVGLDGRLRYERSLPFGFQLGTDWGYKTVMHGGRFVYFDQQPDIWFLTASHLFSSKIVILENRISLFESQNADFSAKFNAGIRKQFLMESRWALAPTVSIFEYVFDAGAYDDEWPSSRSAHYAEFRTELGIDLEFLF